MQPCYRMQKNLAQLAIRNRACLLDTKVLARCQANSTGSPNSLNKPHTLPKIALINAAPPKPIAASAPEEANPAKSGIFGNPFKSLI